MEVNVTNERSPQAAVLTDTALHWLYFKTKVVLYGLPSLVTFAG